MFSWSRNILPLLVMVCLISLIIRGLEVYSGVKQITGIAQAVEPEQKTTQTDDHPDTELEEEQHNETPSTAGATHDLSANLDDARLDYEISPIQAELAQDLIKQKERLDQRETLLQQKEALLSAAEQELDRKYQELVTLRGEIEALLDKQSEEEDTRITSLVKIYENMKAKEAASIFNTLDLDILVEVIARMSERKVSPILAAMNPERARTVTIMLAEQKKLPTLPMP